MSRVAPAAGSHRREIVRLAVPAFLGADRRAALPARRLRDHRPPRHGRARRPRGRERRAGHGGRHLRLPRLRHDERRRPPPRRRDERSAVERRHRRAVARARARRRHGRRRRRLRRADQRGLRRLPRRARAGDDLPAHLGARHPGHARRPRRHRRAARPAGHDDPARRLGRSASARTSCSTCVFVYGLHWGIAGSAWGTVIAQTGMGLALVTVLLVKARAGTARLRPHPGTGPRGRAAPAYPCSCAPSPCARRCSSRRGSRRRSATCRSPPTRCAMTVWSFLAFALDALAIAAQAITGRALGARRPRGRPRRPWARWCAGASWAGSRSGSWSRPCTGHPAALHARPRRAGRPSAAALVVVGLGQAVVGLRLRPRRRAHRRRRRPVARPGHGRHPGRLPAAHPRRARGRTERLRDPRRRRAVGRVHGLHGRSAGSCSAGARAATTGWSSAPAEGLGRMPSTFLSPGTRGFVPESTTDSERSGPTATAFPVPLRSGAHSRSREVAPVRLGDLLPCRSSSQGHPLPLVEFGDVTSWGGFSAFRPRGSPGLVGDLDVRQQLLHLGRGGHRR